MPHRYITSSFIPAGLIKHRFIKDIAVLSSGKVISAAVRIALVPVIARLYLPGDYGVAALFLSITTVLAPLGILSFPQAMVLPEENGEAARLGALAFLGLMLLAVILWLLIAACQAAGYTPFPELEGWLWAIPAAVILQGGLLICENWLTRNRAFGLSAVGDVAQTATIGGFRIGSGMIMGSLVWSLIGSIFLGQIARIVVYWRSLLQLAREAAHQRLASYRKLIREFRQFPLYNTPAAVLFSLNGQLPLLVIGWLFSTDVTGRYAMVHALIVMALTTIGESVRRAYLHRSARSGMEIAALRRDHIRATSILAATGAMPALILLFFCEPLFSMLLSDRWVGAGTYAAALVPFFYLRWVSLPSSALMITLRRQREWLLFQMTTLAGQCAGMALGYLLTATPVGLVWGGSLARGLLLASLVWFVASALREGRNEQDPYA